MYFNISKRYNFKVEIRGEGGKKCRMYTKFFTSKCFIKLEVEY